MRWMIVRTIERKDRASAWWGALAGAAGGAGAMALRDRRQRAELAQKASHLARELAGAGQVLGEDLRNRTVGFVSHLAGRLRREQVADGVILARVRSRLGRACSQPSAIESTMRDGEVLLSGPVLESEARSVIAAVARVKGVRRVIDHLVRHASAEGIPALQGAHPRGLASGQRYWSPTARLMTALMGAGMAGWGFAARGIGGFGVGVLGSGLLLRAMTNLQSGRLFGIGAGRRAIDIDKSIYVEAPPELVFAFFRAFENFPRFMTHIAAVRSAGEGRSHWVIRGPAGAHLEWDAEITSLIPNQVLAWKSVPGTIVEQSGVIRFLPEGVGTRVTIRLSYNPLGGAIGHTFARMLGADPKKLMDEDLLRLKSLLETGKARGREGFVTRDELPLQS